MVLELIVLPGYLFILYVFLGFFVLSVFECLLFKRCMASTC